VKILVNFLGMGQMVGAKGRVIGIDHVKELIFRSQENLEKNFSHLSNRIKFVVGEGREGFLSEGPYDVINIGGAVTEVSQPILNQLKTGGRLIAPIGPSNDTQELTTIDKLQSGSLKRNCHLKVIFGSIKSLKSQIED
jgi:protein-L-isoaspartate(D-aspartate) O-methyltransferase